MKIFFSWLVGIVIGAIGLLLALTFLPGGARFPSAEPATGPDIRVILYEPYLNRMLQLHLHDLVESASLDVQPDRTLLLNVQGRFDLQNIPGSLVTPPVVPSATAVPKVPGAPLLLPSLTHLGVSVNVHVVIELSLQDHQILAHVTTVKIGALPISRQMLEGALGKTLTGVENELNQQLNSQLADIDYQPVGLSTDQNAIIIDLRQR